MPTSCLKTWIVRLSKFNAQPPQLIPKDEPDPSIINLMGQALKHRDFLKRKICWILRTCWLYPVFRNRQSYVSSGEIKNILWLMRQSSRSRRKSEVCPQAAICSTIYLQAFQS